MCTIIEGKIYKLTSSVDNYFYIGSTTRTLELRFQQHKNDSKRACIKAYDHFNTIGWDNIKITLIESITCLSKNELQQRESELIFDERENKFCLNKKLPVVTKQIASTRYMENLREKMKLKREISNRAMEKQYAYWANRIKLESQGEHTIYL
ncbi:GIY-YIG nuclease family protein [bacterium]|nr:GIY-YIG nuclease family protein [Candidatus Elulimicrobium humile]